jgi:hypothetical protein
MRIFRVGHNHTIIGIYGVHTVFSREITIHTVIYGADIWFWPTLCILFLVGECTAFLAGELTHTNTHTAIDGV